MMRAMRITKSSPGGLRQRLYEVIFEADTPPGKLFDVALIVCILASVLVVMLTTVEHLNRLYGDWFLGLEWAFTVLFSIEYALRLFCVRRRLRYVFSFFGLVDLVSVLPTYVAVFVPGGHYFLVVRLLRVLRVFRVLKLAQYMGESRSLARALLAARHKIIVFLFYVLALAVLFGSAMYVIEGAQSGFTSIPRGIYWAVVTLTTVGYGDISPQTGLGQFVSAIIMIMGYGIIAVPTGIVSVEMAREARTRGPACPRCDTRSHAPGARFCHHCGKPLAKADEAEA